MRARRSGPVVALLPALLAAGCVARTDRAPDDAAKRRDARGARAVDVEPAARDADAVTRWRAGRSRKQEFDVRWRPLPDPVPENEPFELEVRIAPLAGSPGHAEPGASVLPEDAHLAVTAQMPGHGHGMLRAPRAERVGPGHFRVRGMLFHMRGHWVLELQLQTARSTDRATFEVDLPESVAVPRGAAGLSSDELARILTLSPLPEPPDDPTNAVQRDPRAARLGQALFFDERLSGPGTVSCATCHVPDESFADGREVGVALGELDRNTLALWNVAHNRWFFWDGRADSLWAQALHPLEDPREHGGDRTHYAHLVAGDDELARAYRAVFGELPDLSDRARFPLHARPDAEDPTRPHALAWTAMAPADRAEVDRVFSNLGKALAAYQTRLVSRRAPFDVFVEGLREGDPTKLDALSASALRGLRLFVGRGNCHFCHSGPSFTDFEFHNNRVPAPRDPKHEDPGRHRGVDLVRADPFNGLGAHSDATPEHAQRVEAKLGYLFRVDHNWGEFKTPSLRNVARTAPYMHQGQLATLEDVVRHYSTIERTVLNHHYPENLLQPLDLADDEIADLVAFLEALTDEELPPELTGPPPGRLLEGGEDAPPVSRASSRGRPGPGRPSARSRRRAPAPSSRGRGR